MNRSSSTRQNSNKQTTSVWVDGNAVAQDARDKLRTADEARFMKKTALETYGASSSLSTPLICPSPSSPQADSSYMSNLIGRQDQATGSGNTLYKDDDYETTSNAALPHPRPTLGRLRIPSSRFIAQPTTSGEDADGLVSPLMFVDSDISSSSSPIDQPTSATSTDATTSSSNRESQINSPRKRECSPSTAESLSPLKKIRSMSLAEIRVVRSHRTRLSPPMGGFTGDNRQVIREAAFIERTPAGVLPASYNQHIPESSSFRPSIASPEGLEPAPAQVSHPKSPVLSSERRSSSETPEPPETPSYARPLHLFDTSVIVGGNQQGNEWLQDISIYKNIHGEEWKRNALCSHCFRSGGTCNRIMTYGYEACGRDDPLDSHYWEPTANPSY
ncbi:hypothetical protein PTMSG1_09392 [Pyrenophora teres f. maculata]|nr:hypothetical protein PTMSG1_09392 [Pyrenophora teres f. maculata]